MIGVVVSRADNASVLIGEQLRTYGEWTTFQDPDQSSGWGDTGARRPGLTIREFDDLHLTLESVATTFDTPELIIFASRHSGDTGPLLSTHFTGNFGTAEYGGAAHELATAAPNAAAKALTTLADTAPPDYSVTMECTHHGPTTVGTASLFIEIGSSEHNWNDPDAADAAAQAILALCDQEPTTDRTIVTIGDGHYVPRATRINQETDWAVGHCVPDWALTDFQTGPDHLTDQLFQQSGANHAVLTNPTDTLETTIEDAGYSVVSETWVRETSGVPLDRVTTIEERMTPIPNGLRFGDHAATADTIELHTVSAPLVETVNGVDVDATRTAVDTHSVAYTTTDGGTRFAGDVAVNKTTGIDPLIDAFITILDTNFDSIEREPTAIVVTETVFDPDAATELGVPEGPKFGELAAGNTVTIDGETIHPEQVTTTRTRRLPV